MASISRLILKSNILKLLAFGCAAVIPNLTWAADDSLSARVQIALGGWRSKFSQSDSTSHSTDVWSLTSLGLQAQVGMNISLAFIEWNTALLLPSYTPPDRREDAQYFALLGLNAGVKIPLLPVEVYGGIEGAGYDLSGGVAPNYKGVTGKVGTNIFLQAPGTHLRTGIKAEFRRTFIGEDDAGAIPEDVTTQSDIYFLGLTIGWG